MSSKIPADSPARTMFTYISSKIFGCFASASAKVDPPSIFSVTSPKTLLSPRLSVCWDKEFNVLSRGTPALIIALNSRVKITKCLPFTLAGPIKILDDCFFLLEADNFSNSFKLIGLSPCFTIADIAAALSG